MKRIACCLLLCAWTAAALAGASPAEGDASGARGDDFLLITAGADHYNSGALGSNGSFDWVHQPFARSTCTLGLAVYSVGDSRWSFGKLGAARRLNDRVTVQGQASLGGGQTAGNPFGYQAYDGSLTYKVAQRVYVRLGDQFFQIADSRDHLLKPGLVVVPSRRALADLTYAHSVSGNVGTQFFSGRIDFTAQAVHLLGGFSFGHSTPQSLNLEIGSAPRLQSFREGFLGVGVPLSNTVLSVVLDVLNLEASRRRSLIISWKVPIGKRGNQRP